MLLFWILFIASKCQQKRLCSYWTNQWVRTCLPWTANARYLHGHWGHNNINARDFIVKWVTEGNRIKNLLHSEWATARLFSAVGELIVNGGAWESMKLLWHMQDVLIFLFVGEWLRGTKEEHSSAGGITN